MVEKLRLPEIGKEYKVVVFQLRRLFKLET